MRSYEAIAQVLVDEGVDTVFTLIAEDIMRLLSHIDSSHQSDLRIVHTRHEQGAMAMADGYARAGEGIGVAIVGRGPAIAQTGTSLQTASKNGSDMLVIVPETPLAAEFDLKEFEQDTYLDAVARTVTTVRSGDRLVPELRDAFRTIRVGDGPVVFQLPWDLLDAEIDLDGIEPRSDRPDETAQMDPHPARIEEAVDRFKAAELASPPIVLAGAGAVAADAKDSLISLAERTGGLLATSLQARDYFADHPYSLGVVGGFSTEIARRFVADSEFVFAVGCSLNPYTTDDGALITGEETIVHIDTDPASFDRHTPVDVAIHGDAAASATALVEAFENGSIDRSSAVWHEELRTRLAEAPTFSDRDFADYPDRVDPRELMASLNELLPEDPLVVNDGGHFNGWIVDAIRTTHPSRFVWTLDFLSMGLGLSTGIGAAVAADGNECITFCGDLGFMMGLPDLETAVRHEVPITVIVVNDEAAGVEYQHLLQAGIPEDVALVDTPEFADIATAFGAEGYTVRDTADLEAIEDVLREPPGRPVVIDCQVNPAVRHRSLERLTGVK